MHSHCSVTLHSWTGIRKSIWPVKIEWWGAGDIEHYLSKVTNVSIWCPKWGDCIKKSSESLSSKVYSQQNSLHDDIFSYFNRAPTCDGQKDTQAEGCRTKTCTTLTQHRVGKYQSAFGKITGYYWFTTFFDACCCCCCSYYYYSLYAYVPARTPS